jgi:hypothetical protein
MPKAEWGVKRTCPNCEARFYDLQREPIVCPECGAAFAIDTHGKVSAARDRRAPVPVADDEAALVEDESLEDADEDEDEPLLADDDDEEGDDAGPVLAEESDEEEEVATFKDAGIVDEDEIGEDVDDEDDEDGESIEELDDIPDDDHRQGT